MELMMLMYMILAGFSLLVTFVIVMVISGRAMIFEFYRRFSKKGCDVFMVDNNRQVSHHFLKAKDGVFRIDGKPYITNPYKISQLTDDMQKQVMEKLDIKKKRMEKAIDNLKEKKSMIEQQLKCIESKEENLPTIQNLQSFKTEIDNKISLMRAKIQEREEAYYLMKRPAYFYIENDPVPKDFFELFTQMDSTQLENVIIRAQTKDPKNLAKLEKDISNIKKLVGLAAIGSIAAAFIAARVMSMITQLGAHSGVSFTI